MLDHNAHVLLIYTGGTIGMVEDEKSGALKAFDFDYLKSHVPELNRLRFTIDSFAFNNPIDSSDMNPERWQQIVRIIEENYEKYDGFVILHGTDTMAYTASALSFMLENLNKPVILTGSQLPIGKIRTDAKENLITALEIAVDKGEEGEAFIPEVCIFFQDLLLRGNRTTKINADNFNAFSSFSYQPLAEAGTYIRYQHQLIHRPEAGATVKFHYLLDPNVTILKLFPGISADMLRAIFSIPNMKGVVMETYGAGNAPGEKWFLDILRDAVDAGIVVVNVTQCLRGRVEMQRYQSGRMLGEIGVISGRDITTEAAVTKLMTLFGHGYPIGEIKERMSSSVAGEMSI